MGKIHINTDINAPCCPCEIVHEDGNAILAQSDWTYPGYAQTFGWSLRAVQRDETRPCDHDPTDGTVDCKDCGVTASEFMSAAYDFLSENDGLEVDDPGYFEEV